MNSEAPVDETAAASPVGNIDSLLTHLTDDSLAAILVRAYQDPGDASPPDAMLTALKARIANAEGQSEQLED